MHRITTVEDLEARIGTPRQVVMMKQIDALDDGCRVVLAHAPIAALGFRDPEGLPHTIFIGGTRGFARVHSPTRLSFDLPPGQPGPAHGGGVSLVFLLPGIGETLRLNGTVVDRPTITRVAIDLTEAFVHCARSILRSGLWEPAPPITPNVEPAEQAPTSPLADPSIAAFLAASPFAAVSSWDARGASDTSPRGDQPGFLRILDGHTLAMPDRRGNQRADTSHNLLCCDQLALAALVPARDLVLHLRGTATITDDPELLATMALAGKPPLVALIFHVDHATLTVSDALRRSNLWHRSAHVPRSDIPDLMTLAAEHLAASKTRGALASLTRGLTRGLAVAPNLMRRAVDFGYRKQLDDEGYGQPPPPAKKP